MVDKKWMANIAIHIKTEMDAISYRLTERIKEPAEYYETPLPELTEEMKILTKKVNEHLKKMEYTF